MTTKNVMPSSKASTKLIALPDISKMWIPKLEPAKSMFENMMQELPDIVKLADHDRDHAIINVMRKLYTEKHDVKDNKESIGSKNCFRILTWLFESLYVDPEEWRSALHPKPETNTANAVKPQAQAQAPDKLDKTLDALTSAVLSIANKLESLDERLNAIEDN